MVDMCALVKEHFALPIATYSIKEVAPVFGFKWQADDAGGLNSEAWFDEWMDTGNEELTDKLLSYNLDDVVAMEVVWKALTDVLRHGK